MFRTIKLKLPYDSSLVETGKQFMKACQIVLDYGFAEKTYNKNRLNRGTYRDVREKIPTLPSALVQTARDAASESLKQTGLKKEIHRKSYTIRYDKRTFRFQRWNTPTLILLKHSLTLWVPSISIPDS